jgi:hypothetical protein
MSRPPEGAPSRVAANPGQGFPGGAMTTVVFNTLQPRAIRSTEDQGRPGRPEPVPGRRSLIGYLLMPRPGDAVKALLMPSAFGLGVLANGGTDGRTVLRALLVLLVLEFLVYPARYQWNDIRGFTADQRHPGKDRGRLPGPLSAARSRIAASSVVAVLRLAAAGIVAVLPGLQIGTVVLFVIVGVFGVAGVYEALRTAATGRHEGDGPPPVRAALMLLWITVGAGYAVRGMTGLALAVDLRERPAVSVAAALMLWAYGVAFVTSRWAVESLAHARLHGLRVHWSADAAQAREHLLALTRWLPPSVDGHAMNGPAGGSLNRWAALRGRTPLCAPWNAAVAITGAAAAMTGILLATADAGAAAWIVAAFGGLASLATARLPRWRLLVVGAGGAGLLVAPLAASAAQPLVALLPWLAVMVAYVHFSAQCLDTMGELGRRVRSTVGRALTPLARAVVGHPTWQTLASKGPAHG